MSNNTEPSPQQSCQPSEEFLAAKGQLQRCIEMLKSAGNDNEKMASLLLFTYLMKNNDSLTCDSTEVFDAIGAKFIVRMLNSKNVPEGCPVFMYKSLALSILASFTEQDLLFHPLIISNLFAIVKVLFMVESPAEAQEMVKDGIKILVMFSRTYTGCIHLLENNCIPVILQAALNNPDSLFEIIKGILHHLPSETWNHSGSELSNLLDLFSRKFAEFQNMEKFMTCEKLLVLLTSLCESKVENYKDNSGTTWEGNIRSGLRHILQSRCKITYKYTALQMAGSMIELFGIEWTLVSDQRSLNMTNTQFWFLLLSITKTEVKMILESGDNDEIQAKSAVIVACYRIIERTIEFLITDTKCGWSFSDDLVLQMHSILLESFDCIIKFLVQLGTSPDTAQSYRRPIVLATVRVLCAWLSEETNSLSDGVSKVLPILLNWARSSLEEGNEASSAGHDDSKVHHEIISYLLPPLCHLSADETFCVILIKEKAHLLLSSVFNQLWQTQQREQQQYPSSLINLCNVFLNFSVLEVERIKTNQVFQDILNCIMVSLPQLVHSNQVTLTVNFTLLGFILFRHRCPLTQTNLSTLETDFLQSGIEFLKQAQVSVGETPQSNLGVSLLKEWDNVSELWFLSVQNFVACAKVIDPVKKTLLSSGWVEETKTWLQGCEGKNEKIFTELKSALSPIASFN